MSKIFTTCTITPHGRFPYVEKIDQGVGLQGEINRGLVSQTKQSGKVSSKNKERTKLINDAIVTHKTG